MAAKRKMSVPAIRLLLLLFLFRMYTFVLLNKLCRYSNLYVSPYTSFKLHKKFVTLGDLQFLMALIRACEPVTSYEPSIFFNLMWPLSFSFDTDDDIINILGDIIGPPAGPSIVGKSVFAYEWRRVYDMIVNEKSTLDTLHFNEKSTWPKKCFVLKFRIFYPVFEKHRFLRKLSTNDSFEKYLNYWEVQVI